MTSVFEHMHTSCANCIQPLSNAADAVITETLSSPNPRLFAIEIPITRVAVSPIQDMPSMPSDNPFAGEVVHPRAEFTALANFAFTFKATLEQYCSFDL